MSKLSAGPHPSSFIWQGRFDGDAPEHQRVFQQIKTKGEVSDFALIGFASDEGVKRNQGRVGASQAPDVIRSQMASLPVHDILSLTDLGNIVCQEDDLEGAQQALGLTIQKALGQRMLPIVLGGGHAIAYGSFQGIFHHYLATEPNKTVGIINFDAHFDLREADKPTSGTPFLNAAFLSQKNNKPFHYLCLGVSEHSNTKVLFDTADNLGVSYVMDEAFNTEAVETLLATIDEFINKVDYLYVTIDIDAFPAYLAPGVSAPAARGIDLTRFETVFKHILASKKVKLFDIAECNPEYDIDNRTAKLAAFFVYQYIKYNQ